jgi:glycosyltransferase involved in cell wall biosynthesis
MKNATRPKHDAIGAPRYRSASRVLVVRYDSHYGGSVYDGMAVSALAGRYEVHEYLRKQIGSRGLRRYGKALAVYWRLWRALRRGTDYDVMIRTYDLALAPMPAGPRHVVIVHHLDFSADRFRVPLTCLAGQCHRVLRGVAAIVVMADFWEEHFRSRGYTNVYRVDNGFDLSQLNGTPAGLRRFAQEQHLQGKPVIYLGNNARGKGVEEALAAVGDLDAHFVVTGKTPHPNPRIRTLYLEYRDYLRLLGCCAVVLTLSRFQEGWCRVAHEAMLCRTPVIGSGAGGMRELLAGGGQAVLTDPASIRREVQRLLADSDRRRAIGERGRAYASAFTVQRTHRQWQDLVGSLLTP